MFRSFLHYLFPSIPLRQRLPLLSREFSSKHGRYKLEADRTVIALLKGYGLARTDQDAQRLLKRYPEASVLHIFKAEKRRRRHDRIKRAVRRFKRLWQ